MIPIKDKDGNTLVEVDESLFPLKMPIQMRLGEKEYLIKVFYEDDGTTPRSALLNTKHD